MLNIAVVTRYFPSSGEPWQGRSAYQSLRALSRYAKVQVFYPNAAYPSFLKPRTRLYQELDRSFSPPEVGVTYVNYPALPLLSRPLNGKIAAQTLLPLVRTFKPDLILGIFLYPEGYAALELGKQMSIPVVTMGIGSDIHSIADRFSRLFTQRVLRESDFLLTVSDDLRQKAIGMGASPETSRAILNGCDLSIFHPSDSNSARRRLNLALDVPTVVYVGRLDRKKGLLELVEAAAKLQVTLPELQVYLVGQGADKPQVINAIEARGAVDFVHVMSPCLPDDVALWLTAADVITLPSYMEGCPNVVLEALACGRPVVATKVGGIPELMDETCGRLIPSHDAGALATALESVLATSWNATSIAAKWSRSWGDVASELLDVFDLVATSRTPMVHG